MCPLGSRSLGWSPDPSLSSCVAVGRFLHLSVLVSQCKLGGDYLLHRGPRASSRIELSRHPSEEPWAVTLGAPLSLFSGVAPPISQSDCQRCMGWEATGQAGMS